MSIDGYEYEQAALKNLEQANPAATLTGGVYAVLALVDVVRGLKNEIREGEKEQEPL